MADETYYIRSRGRVAGPYDVGQLREMYRRGTLSSVHELSTDQAIWRPAREYHSLLCPAPPKSPPAHQPAAPSPSGLTPVPREPGTLQFACPKCRAHLAVPANRAGGAGRCRACGATITIPSQNERTVLKKCPACAELIQPDARKCQHCGERLDGDEPAEDTGLGLTASEIQDAMKRSTASIVPYKPASPVLRVCPGCGATSPSSSVICTACGFDHRTGRHVSETVQSAGTPYGPPVVAQSNVHIHGGNAGFQSLMVFEIQKKSLFLAYVFWFFFGGVGAHRFYAGKKETGVAMLLMHFTGWGLICSGTEAGGVIGVILVTGVGLWVLVDAFLIPQMIREFNLRLASQLRT